MTAPNIEVETCRDLPLVHFQVVFAGGALTDAEGAEGRARLGARLIRRGTRQQSATEVEDAIDSLGGELGIEVGFSYVRVHGSVIRRNAEALLALAGELVREPALREGEFAQLKRETLASLTDLLDNDGALASAQLRRLLYGTHPYARSVLGTRASVEQCSLQDVRAYHGQTLARGPILVGFAGDVSDTEAQRWTADFLGQEAGEDVARPRPPQVEPPPACEGRVLVVVDKPTRTQTQMYVGAPGTHCEDDDHHALILGNAVFGGTFTSRLMRAVRSERGWSYGASSRLGVDRTRDLWTMWTHPAAADAADCLALQLELMTEWVRGGVDEEELRFAQSYLGKSFAFAVDTAEKRLDQRIEQRLLGLPDNYYSQFVHAIQAVRREQVNAALARRLSPDNLRISLLATEADVGPQLRKRVPLDRYEVRPHDQDA